MSVALYDEAFLKKLQAWTKDTQVTILSPDESRSLFAVNADLNNDSPIKLPLIALKRVGGFNILRTGKGPMSASGATLSATTERSRQLNAIPISIPYQLDIYTRYLREADEYVRNIVFNIVNYPRLDIIIPYNDENRIHESNIRLEGEVNDNSSIPERLISGQFTRMTMRINIDDAYLFDVRKRDVIQIHCVNLKADDLYESAVDFQDVNNEKGE